MAVATDVAEGDSMRRDEDDAIEPHGGGDVLLGASPCHGELGNS